MVSAELALIYSAALTCPASACVGCGLLRLLSLLLVLLGLLGLLLVLLRLLVVILRILKPAIAPFAFEPASFRPSEMLPAT